MPYYYVRPLIVDDKDHALRQAAYIAMLQKRISDDDDPCIYTHGAMVEASLLNDVLEALTTAWIEAVDTLGLDYKTDPTVSLMFNVVPCLNKLTHNRTIEANGLTPGQRVTRFERHKQPKPPEGVTVVPLDAPDALEQLFAALHDVGIDDNGRLTLRGYTPRTKH